MARTTDQLLAQIERVLPAQFRPLRPHLAGLAAMFRRCEQLGDDFKTAATVGGAEAIWLTLLAHGQGIDRATGETDASLRSRVRAPEDKLTPIAILAVVNALLLPYTSTEAQLLEHWRNGAYCDDDGYADQAVLYDQHNAFTLVLPSIGSFNQGDAFCDDDAYADDCYLGQGGGEHPVYASIVSAVDKVRAAGVRVWIVVEDPAPPLAEAILSVAPGARMLWSYDAGIDVTSSDGIFATWRNQMSESFHLPSGSPDVTLQSEADGLLLPRFQGVNIQTVETTSFDDFTLLALFVSDLETAAEEVVVDHEYVTGFWFGHLAGTEPPEWGGGVLEGVPPYGEYAPTASGTRVAYMLRRTGTTRDVIKNAVVVETAVVAATATGPNVIAVGSAITGATEAYNCRPIAIVIWPRGLDDLESAALQEIFVARGLVAE